MSDLINSPLILSIIFPLLTMLGTLPLLRWAVAGDKQDVFASFGVTLACMIALVCAYGRPGAPFQFGMAAMIYALGSAGVLMLMINLWVQNPIAKTVLSIVSICLWGWVATGMPVELSMLFKTMLSLVVLVSLGLIFSLRAVHEVKLLEDAPSAFIPLLVISVTLLTLSYWGEDQSSRNFAAALCVILAACLFWSVPRLAMAFQDNAIMVIALGVAALAWEMWLQGALPMIGLIALSFALFARPPVARFLNSCPEWMGRAYYIVLCVFCMLPALLGVVFSDVLQAL